jgi:hypothetical protein
VFTARYALSPYIKQIRLAFKGLISAIDGGKKSASRAGCYPSEHKATRLHWIGDFVGPLASLDYKKIRKNSCSCLESNHGSYLFNP